jgi:hypothetical protein
MSDGVNFAKNYQKDSYNILKIIKKKDDKNVLTTLKKHLYFSNFQESFTTYK